jgi:hypothetical protein
VYARDKEIFGFVGGSPSYENYDWSVVSTVAWASDPQMICEAHKHGARAVMAAPKMVVFPADEKDRSQWISDVLTAAQRGNYDGITFDYEYPIDGKWSSYCFNVLFRLFELHLDFLLVVFQ